MRISASTTMLTLAMCLGAAAAWEGFGSSDVLEPWELTGVEAATAANPTSRCDLETTRINEVLQKRIPGALEDGCGSEDDWEDLDGTQRYRGNVVDGQTGVTCDRSKRSFKGTGKRGNTTAALSSTETLYGEDSTFARSEVTDAKVRETKYDSRLRKVFNRFYDTTTFAQKGTASFETSMCSNGAPSGNAVSCPLVAASSVGSLVLIARIDNPTNTTYRNLKATLTFANNVTVVKMLLPKGSPRVTLPSIGTSKDEAGTVVSVSKLEMPLASKTLPSGGSMVGVYGAGYPGVNAITGQVTLTITSGKETICTYP